MIVQKSRSTLIFTDTTVTKVFKNPDAASVEARWYHRAPWAGPELLGYDNSSITVRRLPSAKDHPGYRPVDQLIDLILRLAGRGIHHRDVHPGNILIGGDGPLLIDWECACYAPGPSYDIWGPDVSGVPVPDIHAEIRSQYPPWRYHMWLNSIHPDSIMNRWNAGTPIDKKRVNGAVSAGVGGRAGTRYRSGAP